MNRIEQSYLIAAPLEEVWSALTDPTVIKEWSGATATYAAQPDMEYSLWDGSIAGRILEVEPKKRLYKTWKPDTWTRDDSVVTFFLTPVKGGTRVDLVHENVQESDFEGTSEGWNQYYLGAIQRMFERNRKPSLAKKSSSIKRRIKKSARVGAKAKSKTPKKKATRKPAKRK